MKRIFTILTMALAFISAMADTTTDRLTATSVTLNLAEDNVEYIEIMLMGDNLYTAYSMDIYLPEGLDFALDEDGEIDTYISAAGIYPSKKGLLSSHSLASRYHADRNMLALACISVSSQEFTDTKGLLLYVGVKANDKAKPGDMKVEVKNIHLINKDAVDFTTDDIETTVSASAATAVLDASKAPSPKASYTLGGIRMSGSAKGTIVVSEGKKRINK